MTTTAVANLACRNPACQLHLLAMDTISRQERLIASGICAAFIAQCLGYALLLPPWEGFDETAHFSYISLLADRGEIPDFRWTPLDARVEKGTTGMPQPYGGTPPFENNGGLTYHQFFAERSPQQQWDAARQFWQQPIGLTYRGGRAINWEAQHPPLYYAFMTVPYRLFLDQSLGVQLTVLRLMSVAMACGSIWFWWLSLLSLKQRTARMTWLAGGAMVLALPSCWFDLGRLGNDSLAACCLSAIVCFLLRTAESGRWRDLACLALACICGLLTKAFFVPICAAAALYACVAWSRQHGWRYASLRTVVLVSAMALCAGWWFVDYAQRYGSPLGSYETWLAAQRTEFPGDALSPLAFAYALVRGSAAWVATFFWCGTWSWVRRPDWHYAAVLPLMLLCLIGSWQALRKSPDGSRTRLIRLSALLLAPLLCGFAVHLVLRIRLTGIGSGTAGYYLFFAWPLVGLLLSGFWQCAQLRLGRWLILGALFCAGLLEWSGLWYCLQVFAGIIEKTGSSSRGIGALLPLPESVALVLQRLELLCFPRIALPLLAGALVVKAGLWLMLVDMLSAMTTGQVAEARPESVSSLLRGPHFGRQAAPQSARTA